MDMQQIREFVSLVETTSFQETAERVNVSQSTLSKHIRKMEDELGVTFFDRSTRTVSTNEFSKAYYPYAKLILQAYSDGCSALKSLSSRNKMVLAVAFTPGSTRYGVIELLSGFSQKNPQFSLQIEESHDLMKLLAEHSCDFAFATEEIMATQPFDKMNRIVYKIDALVVALPKNHPLANEKTISLEQLIGEKYILHIKDDGTPHLDSQKFLACCEEKGVSPEITAKIAFTSTIVKMVQNGQGVAVLNRNSIPEEAGNMAIVNLYPRVETYIYLIYPSNTRLSVSARTFLNYVLAYVDDDQ